MSVESKNPVRILHVVGGMNLGGAETWLMHLLRHIDRKRFQFDFLVHTTNPCTYDEEIRNFGSHIIPCLTPSKPWRYASNFARALKTHGPYDIIHSHVHHYSGFVLQQAKRLGVPIRISHSHSDTSWRDLKAGVLRKGYLQLMAYLIRRHATVGLAASNKAADALYGIRWKDDPRWRLLFCSIDLSPFVNGIDPSEVRAELGMAEDAFVVGHVGRFVEPKNHGFLLDIAKCLVRKEPRAKLLFIGDGPLRSAMESKAARLGLTGHVIFAGLRADVPRLMRGAMNAFLFPSLYEGLPLALVEAQAAGCPCFFSDVIPVEADVVPPLINRFSLDQPAEVWADALAPSNGPRIISQAEALKWVSQSPFNISNGLKMLCDVYSTGGIHPSQVNG